MLMYGLVRRKANKMQAKEVNGRYVLNVSAEEYDMLMVAMDGTVSETEEDIREIENNTSMDVDVKAGTLRLHHAILENLKALRNDFGKCDVYEGMKA